MGGGKGDGKGDGMGDSGADSEETAMMAAANKWSPEENVSFARAFIAHKMQREMRREQSTIADIQSAKEQATR
jgi:hypothetical protein